MDKHYQPAVIEKKGYERWERLNGFQPQLQGSTAAYSLVIPPPNVTGSLHMGHGFQHTLMDALTRYHRMSGKDTLWQVGCDHAGIATQMVVERELAKQQKTRHDIGRDAFVDTVHRWKDQYGGTICQQIRRLGASVDWSRERFTMDALYSAVVQKVFIELYREGLIYRGQRLVNWDPRFRTAISDLEVLSEEEDGFLWHIRYPLSDGSDHLTIATTRPETLLGDTAVAVHPDDTRYQSWIGKTLHLPLTDRHIPIIADDYVDPAFGSGCVKITPAHDFNDYAVGQRHQLPIINILTPDAKLNNTVPAAYRGLDRFTARQQVLADLTAQQLLAKTEPHRLKIPRGDRSGEVIEPYLTDQWFVKTEPLAKPAIAAVENGEIEFIPANWCKTYFQWLENIEDWCISRQLWWGHRIPAWYDESGAIYVGESESAVRAHYQLPPTLSLRQDDDVLDTWFSSALWPFATLGWPDHPKELARYYPTDVLVTGFDIIFFWVARMVMMSLKFTRKVPFRQVYITGLIRDADGQKMSKSKGNVLDPLDLIDGIELQSLLDKRTAALLNPKQADAIRKATAKQFPQGIAAYGTDALRFTFCSLASTGRNIRFDLGRLEGYRNFCNKLWNAARYVLMQCEHPPSSDTAGAPETLTLADQWIWGRLQHVIAECHRHFAQYRFDLLSQMLYEFIWHDFCDWYLELVKPVLSAGPAPQTRQTLAKVLETSLRLLHPLMPFITEEIWQKIAPLCDLNATNETLMLQAYPQVVAQRQYPHAQQTMAWLQQIIIAIRTIRAEMNIAPGKPLPIIFRQASSSEQQTLENEWHFVQALARLSDVRFISAAETPPPAATALVGDLEIFLPMAGLIDKQAELARLEKALGKLQKEHQACQQKLANPNYLNKAPSEVVENERGRLHTLTQDLEKLSQQRAEIAALPD